MDTTPICPSCGNPLASNAPKGLCPECLMKGAFPTGTEAGEAHEKGSRFIPPRPEELAQQFPQLEILQLVGQGGMGAVYQARQKELDRFVALKILPPDIGRDPAFAERFAREAKALARLNHPGIVTIYDFGRTESLFYFLMEFVDGINLRQLLNAGRVSPREALAIVPQICDALQFAHDQGIVHRDIKPENILLDRRGRVKVADFGLAKLVGAGNDPAQDGGTSGPSALTESGKIMGTPNYMAPEQKTNPGDVDHRADIYALGVVFYQMLTGELPGKSIEPPSKKVLIDVRLDEVVLRALEKKPELRYQQVSEVKTLVETIVASDNPGVAPAWLKLSGCYYSTPEHLQSVVGRFVYIYCGKGTLRLDEENLAFASERFEATIPLRAIRALRIGTYPGLAKPLGLDYLFVEYKADDQFQTILLTPALSPFSPTWRTNERVAEWLVAIQQAIIKAGGQATVSSPNKSAGQPWKKSSLLVPILIGLIIPMILAAWKIHLKSATEVQRGALQLELSNKLGEILADRRITYGYVTFDFVPNAPRVLARYGGLKDWRDVVNPNGVPPRASHGDLVLNFTPPNSWLVSGTGDLAEINTSFQASAPGFVWWSATSVQPQPKETAKPVSPMISHATPDHPLFGPVAERLIRPAGDDKAHCFLDLDTGLFCEPPPEVSLAMIERFNGGISKIVAPDGWAADDHWILDWAEKSGADLMFWSDNDTTNSGFAALYGGLAAPLTQYGLLVNSNVVLLNGGFDKAHPEDVLQQITAMAQVVKTNAQPPPFALLGVGGVYVIQTHKGGVGILEITAVNNDPYGIRLRYKLVQTNDGKAIFTSPFATPPRLRFLAWQDEWATNRERSVWHPDGSPVTNATELTWLKSIPPDRTEVAWLHPQPRFLYLWFSDPSFDRSSLCDVSLLNEHGKEIPLGANGCISSKEEDPSELDGNLGWIVKTLSPALGAHPPGHVTVRLRFTRGPLKHIQEIPVKSSEQMSMTLEDESMLNGVGQNAAGNAFVSIAVNTDKMKSRKFSVEALTKDGHRLMTSPNESSFADGSGASVAEFDFNVPLTGVAKFIIGTRPIRTVEWTNVTLPGGPAVATAPIVVQTNYPAAVNPVTIPPTETQPAATRKDLPPGLVALWSCEGNANDSIGSNNGWLLKRAGFAPGVIGQAFAFNASGDGVVASAVNLPDGTSDRTIDFWVCVKSYVPFGETAMVGYGNFGMDGQAYYLGLDINRHLIFSQWGRCILGPILDLDHWHNVAVTSAGTNNIKLYLDGVRVAKGALSFDTPPETQFLIGQVTAPYVQRQLIGLIDEIAVYNRALSGSEIKAIYLSQKPMGSAATSSRPHLAETQVIAIAKPMLPLAAGPSCHAQFSNGTWDVWTEPDKPDWGAMTVVSIRDSDGKILCQTIYL
jgi:serine/threonine protein kinase